MQDEPWGGLTEAPVFMLCSIRDQAHCWPGDSLRRLWSGRWGLTILTSRSSTNSLKADRVRRVHKRHHRFTLEGSA